MIPIRHRLSRRIVCARLAHIACFALRATLLGVVAPGGWAAAAAVNSVDATTAASSGPDAHFDIVEFRVLGASALERRKIEAAVYPFLGPNKTLQDVEHARAALVTVYKDAGLGTVLVDIPEQSVEDGIVRLKVTEGRIEKVRISGARYYSQRQILAALPALKPGTLP